MTINKNNLDMATLPNLRTLSAFDLAEIWQFSDFMIYTQLCSPKTHKRFAFHWNRSKVQIFTL